MTSLRLVVRRSPVLASEGPTVTVALTLPSDIDCIEEAVALVTRHCLAGEPIREHFRFRLQVALAEALANAILRGNREDSRKSVDVRAVLLPDHIRIHVTDQGSGFDPSAVPEPICDDGIARPGGRGIFLIRRLVDSVEFNEQGNSICMTLRRP